MPTAATLNAFPVPRRGALTSKSLPRRSKTTSASARKKSPRSLAMKRTIDVVAGALGLVVLAPAFALFALAIKLDSRGSVFFRQRRIGRRGVPFTMVKLRTMSEAPPGPVSALTVGEDRRVTRLGRYLRRYKLDELPQLLNVVRGD